MLVITSKQFQYKFQDTSTLAIKSRCTEHIWKVRKIELYSNNINNEDFSPSKSWKPLLQTLKEQMKVPFSKEM